MKLFCYKKWNLILVLKNDFIFFFLIIFRGVSLWLFWNNKQVTVCEIYRICNKWRHTIFLGEVFLLSVKAQTFHTCFSEILSCFFCIGWVTHSKNTRKTRQWFKICRTILLTQLPAPVLQRDRTDRTARFIMFFLAANLQGKVSSENTNVFGRRINTDWYWFNRSKIVLLILLQSAWFQSLRLSAAFLDLCQEQLKNFAYRAGTY